MTGGESFEKHLRFLCSDEQWAIFHRRLHPEQYPPEPHKPWWKRLFR